MKRWRRNAIKREKTFQRNIWIALALLFVAFLAKMEAINFLIALSLAIFILVKNYNPIITAPRVNDEEIADGFRPFPVSPAFRMLSLFFDYRLKWLIWFAAGVGPGYFLYFMLNKLFISP